MANLQAALALSANSTIGAEACSGARRLLALSLSKVRAAVSQHVFACGQLQPLARTAGVTVSVLFMARWTCNCISEEIWGHHLTLT